MSQLLNPVKKPQFKLELLNTVSSTAIDGYVAPNHYFTILQYMA